MILSIMPGIKSLGLYLYNTCFTFDSHMNFSVFFVPVEVLSGGNESHSSVADSGLQMGENVIIFSRTASASFFVPICGIGLS